MSKPKVIAFYLPQYHPTPDNDKWWGKGFTEWTNVGKAKPLFKGHYQPKVPADLGYYDLRLPEVREAQAELAKEAGIYGFCYYHYWFGNGKEELELPFNEVLRLGKPDFPFMLCWANESWHKKFWDKDGIGSSKEMLIEQTYPGEQDHIDHFYRLLPAFMDKRYIKEDGKPLFMIYNPLDFEDLPKFLKLWQELAIQNGFPGICFICQLRNFITQEKIEYLSSIGFSYINSLRVWKACADSRGITYRLKQKIKRLFKLNSPNINNYKTIYKNFYNKKDLHERIIPTLFPNWDHTPRSGKQGMTIINTNPENFYKHCSHFFNKYFSKKYFFLKSWNEWGEGNYMEPDLKYGKGYIRALRKAINESQENI